MSSVIKSLNVLSLRTAWAEPCWNTPSWCICEEKSLVQKYNWKSLPTSGQTAGCCWLKLNLWWIKNVHQDVCPSLSHTELYTIRHWWRQKAFTNTHTHIHTHTHKNKHFSPSESPSQKEMGWMSTKIALSEDISIQMEVIFNKKWKSFLVKIS